jgi:general secretion pathway protein L
MSLRRIADGALIWLDTVAGAIVVAISWLRAGRRVQLIEGEGDSYEVRMPGKDARSAGAVPFVGLVNGAAPTNLPADVAAALRGSQIELVLRPNHFLFRPLELPKRAAEFIDGIVRTQIDRLTPWSTTDAVFGWTQSADTSDDRLSLTVVATTRTRVAPYLQALTRLGAKSIVVSALPQGGIEAAAPIKVFEQGARGTLDVARVRRALLVVLTVTSLAAAIAVTTAQILGDHLDTQQRDLTRRIGERRVALLAGRDAVGGAASAQRALERRKHETAATVMVLEAMSQVLPDHTYVTELRVEGDKLQVIGITRDAPSLIRLMEQSPHFTRATFFAPTTRSPGEPGERFHIEARIRAVFVSGL